MTSPVSSRSGFGNVNTTRNIRAVQLLLGHNKLESTVRYLGIEVDDAWRSQNKPRRDSSHGCDRRPIAGQPADDLVNFFFRATFTLRFLNI